MSGHARLTHYQHGEPLAYLVENGVLDMSGASQLVINMNGGSLTGRVEGVGNVRYSGDVSSVDVDTDAIVRIRRR